MFLLVEGAFAIPDRSPPWRSGAWRWFNNLRHRGAIRQGIEELSEGNATYFASLFREFMLNARAYCEPEKASTTLPLKCELSRLPLDE